METNQQRDGVHRSLKQHSYSQETLCLLKTQDQNYVNHVRAINRRKMIKLKEEMHLMEDSSDNDHDKNESNDHTNQEKDTTKVSKHSLFVDTIQDCKMFDAAKHFDTDPRFMKRIFNRPTKEMLYNAQVKNQVLDPQEILKQRKAKGKSLRELESRMEREEMLLKTKGKMDMQRNMMVD